MAPDDRVASTLAEIRAFGYKSVPQGNAIFDQAIRAARDVPRLLAAIEKVLAKADEWDAEAAGSLLEEISEVQRECAAALRETITTALTGEETADAG